MKFQDSSLNTFRVMLRTKFRNENEQRAITPKVWSFELWFFYTALLFNEISYLRPVTRQLCLTRVTGTP